MSLSLLKPSTARSVARAGASAGAKTAGLAGVSFTRGKATLPDLKYDFGALEPAISGKIMELHHNKHHQTYVTSFNNATEQMQAAEASGDIKAQSALLPLLNFHGGGHINHSLFWENLAPTSQGGGDFGKAGELGKKIEQSYGGLEEMKKKFNAALAGIQGSGWAWLVQDTQTGEISIRTYANQDPVVGQFKPLIGVDAWEHAYYLQYQNRKAEYFSAIWDVINWETASSRYSK